MIWYALAKARRLTGMRWPKSLYLAYLRSKAWQAKRQKVIRRAKYRCERCGIWAGNHFEVHHKTYDNLGAEPLEDLEALCRYCHKVEHGYISVEK